MNKQIRNSFCLLLAAFIWGVAFVAQKVGGDVVGPYTFGLTRFIIGSIVIYLAIIIMDKKKPSSKKPKTKEERRLLLKASILSGTALFFATTLQQVAIYVGAGAGKAGFLTACYILIVPILGIFLGRKCGINVWIGVVLALIGLYKLCINGSLKLEFSDALLLLCALSFSIQILIVDKFSPIVDGVRMSCLQFVVCAILVSIPTLIFEVIPDFHKWLDSLTSPAAWISILYAGVLSCGVAYTFQIIGQEGLNPTLASIIMSLESVFSVLAGAVILKERMSKSEIIGCCLIFIAVCIAQISFDGLFSKNRKNTN